ncbi:MAG: hypothetical protein N3E49_09605, partial [Bacteroidia bacterium]|nr:hypothetical protein [Bacteroidia bacterium]
AEWGVAYGDGEVSVDYIPLSDGTNRKRVEMHVFVNIFFTPQNAAQGWGYVTNLVNDRTTINV